MSELTIGKTALLLSILKEDNDNSDHILRQLLKGTKYKTVTGNVGAMSINKIIATIHTAAIRENAINDSLVANHALYHATYECMLSLLRGQAILGELFRTAGLRYAVVVGNLYGDEGEWIAVAMYGTIGAPIRGNEHEGFGFGICHITDQAGRQRKTAPKNNRNVPW